jgi:hypothetical protein
MHRRKCMSWRGRGGEVGFSYSGYWIRYPYFNIMLMVKTWLMRRRDLYRERESMGGVIYRASSQF